MAKTYIVNIRPISPVAFAVPGIRKARGGDQVKFRNSTNGPIKIRMAASGVLKGLTQKRTVDVPPRKTSEPFDVVDSPGTHEYSVHYNYLDKQKKKRRTGFAIGASSPKVIIDR